MRKLSLILITAIAVILIISARNLSVNNNSNVKIVIGDSVKFSKEEIEEAIDCVKEKFVDFEGCELLQISYDEAKLVASVKGYMTSGRGANNGVNESNVIVLLSNFSVDSSGGDGGFNPDSTYTDWQWILIRDSKTDKWRVDDWGY